MIRIDRVEIFQDFMGGGAWPFLVRGLICQVDSGNERDRGEWLRLCGRFVLSTLPTQTFMVLHKGSSLPKQVCDALRCLGPHARYIGGDNE